MGIACIPTVHETIPMGIVRFTRGIGAIPGRFVATLGGIVAIPVGMACIPGRRSKRRGVRLARPWGRAYGVGLEGAGASGASVSFLRRRLRNGLSLNSRSFSDRFP